MEKQVSSTLIAGRLIQLLGWSTMCVTIPVLVLIAIAQHVSTNKPFSVFWLIASFVIAILYAITSLKIGKAIKCHQSGSKKMGVMICILSFICFIFGIPLGIAAIWFLVKGWSEPLPQI